jgi:transposase InsO family protein
VVVEHGRRHMHIAGITAHPTGTWVAQQARNLLMNLDDRADRLRFLIRDRNSKFTTSFDAIFVDADMRIIRTPIRAPRVNAIAERFIGTLRRECLDHLLITDHAISTSCCASMCTISTRTDLTDHSINAHPRATLHHVPARPCSRYDETGSAASYTSTCCRMT